MQSATLIESKFIDRDFGWPLGRAEKLARRGRLPHYVLPDGSIRFKREEVDRLIQHREPQPVDAAGVTLLASTLKRAESAQTVDVRNACAQPERIGDILGRVMDEATAARAAQGPQP